MECRLTEAPEALWIASNPERSTVIQAAQARKSEELNVATLEAAAFSVQSRSKQRFRICVHIPSLRRIVNSGQRHLCAYLFTS